MSKRQKQYRDILAACREQSTGWLERCNAEPGPHQNKVSRLAVRNALRERREGCADPAGIARDALNKVSSAKWNTP